MCRIQLKQHNTYRILKILKTIKNKQANRLTNVVRKEQNKRKEYIK